ncbi:hypothetical protein PAECIP111890_02019 [Paenibacillus sp. JJ-223]|nr:hypothetical protein PAECIP111890_02019 [Paenibacillus sp. JJ-223]
MVDKLEEEFNSMEETISGDVYIGCGETDAMKQIAQVAKDIQIYGITSTAETKTM